MSNDQTLNNARITGTKNYRVLHSIELVEGTIWKGKIIQQMISDPRGARAQELAATRDWVFFSREYDKEKNDWDNVYHEHEIKNEEVFGLPVLIVPIEKLLFSYQPPTEAGILIPVPGSILSKRSHQ